VIWRRWVSISCHMIHIYRLGHLMIRILLLGLGMQTQRTVWNRENKAASVYKREITSWQGVCAKWMRKKQKIEKRTTDFIKEGQGKRGCLEKSNISKIGGGRETKKERERLGKRKKEWKRRSTRKSKGEIQTDWNKKKKTERVQKNILFFIPFSSGFFPLYSPSLSSYLSLRLYICIYKYILHIHTQICMNRYEHTPHAYWLMLRLSLHQK